MTNYHEVILGLSIAYALLGVVLLALLVFAHLVWPIKAGAIAITSAFYAFTYFETRALLGWSSIDPLPARFKLLSARIVEPHSLEGEPGAVHLWVEALDGDNRPSGVPRAYRLPYNTKLAEKTEEAIKAAGEGRPQGGRTADFRTRETGDNPVMTPEITPSSITTSGGGDPSSGPLDLSATPQDSSGIVFSPLPPPRMPPKDAE
jgi:hypothetical protein